MQISKRVVFKNFLYFFDAADGNKLFHKTLHITSSYMKSIKIYNSFHSFLLILPLFLGFNVNILLICIGKEAMIWQIFSSLVFLGLSFEMLQFWDILDYFNFEIFYYFTPFTFLRPSSSLALYNVKE